MNRTSAAESQEHSPRIPSEGCRTPALISCGPLAVWPARALSIPTSGQSRSGPKLTCLSFRTDPEWFEPRVEALGESTHSIHRTEQGRERNLCLVTWPSVPVAQWSAARMAYSSSSLPERARLAASMIFSAICPGTKS